MSKDEQEKVGIEINGRLCAWCSDVGGKWSPGLHCACGGEYLPLVLMEDVLATLRGHADKLGESGNSLRVAADHLESLIEQP